MATVLGLAQRRSRPWRAVAAGPRILWRLLTSVRVAIVAVLTLGIAVLTGVLLPQAPPAVVDQPELMSAWLDLQRERFGPLAPVFHGLGLFDVFHAWWFLALLSWLTLAVGACTYNRLPRLWRQAFRPPRRVSHGLFGRESAELMADTPAPGDIEHALRRRRFKVWRTEEAGATYFFADRFSWAVMGTLLTHAALILFLAGAFVTRVDAFSTSLTIAEGATAPVFPVKHGGQIQVQVREAVGAFDGRGRPLDYHTDLVLYRGGEEVKRCTVTVNDPCRLDGYRFHQAGFFGYGADVRVRDTETGNTVLTEILALTQPLPSPGVTVRDGDGTTIFDGTVPQTDIVEGAVGSLMTLPGSGRTFWVGLRGADSGWTLVVFDPSGGEQGDRAFIPVGSGALVSGVRFQFDRVGSVPSLVTNAIPLPVTTIDPDDEGYVMLALENAVFGTRDASAGDVRADKTAAGQPVLNISGIAPVTVRLEEGERVLLGRYEYEFVGPRNFTGLSVRKDRGDTLIWIASGMFVTGLVVTLWLPRRRLWLRVKDGELRAVGQGRDPVDLEGLLGQ